MIRNSGYYKVSMEITTGCNFRCVYCPHGNENVEPRYMSLDKARKTLDQIKGLGGIEYVELNLLGEPFLHRNLFEIIDHANSIKLPVRLITNGAYLKPGSIESLCEHKPAMLKVSVETLDESVYILLRGATMYQPYKDYMKTIKGFVMNKRVRTDLSDVQIQLDLLYVPNWWKRRLAGTLPKDWFLKYIYHDKFTLINDVATFLEDMVSGDAAAHIFPLPAPPRSYRLEKLAENFAEIKKSGFSNQIPLYRLQKNLFITLKSYCSWINIKDKMPTTEVIPCNTDKFGILADGRVVLCCSDYDGSTAIGNVFKKPLYDILNDRKHHIYALRKGYSVFEMCDNCQGYFSYRHKLLRGICGHHKKARGL